MIYGSFQLLVTVHKSRSVLPPGSAPLALEGEDVQAVTVAAW